jgi:hypothetical protein
MKPDEKQALISDLKTNHPRLYEMPVDDDEDSRFVLFRQANPGDLTKFRENKAHEQLQFQAEVILASSCKVYPDDANYAALVKDYPGFPYSLANEIWRKARGGEGVAKKV